LIEDPLINSMTTLAFSKKVSGFRLLIGDL